MKTIMVAIDFSPAALNAANYAADMAAAINAEVLLVHVFQLPISYSEVPLSITEADMLADAENTLSDLQVNLLRKTGNKIPIESKVVMGVFYQEIRTLCIQVNPYVVIMGSQGTTSTERLFFGGHTVYAMKHLDWPLITVPKGASFSAIKKIGLACDLQDVLETTPITDLKKLVEDFNASLHILNTGKQEVFDPEIVFQSGLLQEMFHNLKTHYHFITNDNIDEGIIAFAEKNNIDLLVVLPKRHDLLTKLLHSSHTKQLVLHSHVPVMALHH